MTSSVREWPRWLRPAQLDIPAKENITRDFVNLNATVKKKRPLIYVYDLPPEFNSLLLEVGMEDHILQITYSKFLLVNKIVCLRFFMYCREDILSSSV